MDFSAHAKDIDELLAEFVELEGTELAQMKTLWKSRNFSFIHEARPKDVTPSFYAQALYSCALSHLMVEGATLSRKIGGLYVLYILHETQDKDDCYRIYLSIEELEALIKLVVELKVNSLFVAFKVVKRMVTHHMFLYGSVSANQKRIAASVAKLAQQTNMSVLQARSRLLANVPVREHVEGLLAEDLELGELSRDVQDYALSRRRGLSAAGFFASHPVSNEDDEELAVVRDAVKDVEAWDQQKSHMLESALASKKRSLACAVKTPSAVKQKTASKGGPKTVTEYERELRQAFSRNDADKELEEELDRALGL